MRSKIRKLLVSTFQRAIEAQQPRFAPSKHSDGSFRIWQWSIAPSLHFFVALQPFEKDDIFVLEIAWSENDAFPWGDRGGEFRVDKPDWRERLGHLWQPVGKSPVWDLAPELTEARQDRLDALRKGEEMDYATPPDVEIVLPRVAPLVDDSLRKFREYGLPVFERVALHRGFGNALKPGNS